MGRRKKEAQVVENDNAATAVAEPAEQDEYMQKHAALQQGARTLREKVNFFQSDVGRAVKDKIMEEYDDEIRNKTLGLKHIAKADLEKEQGEIAGIEWAKQVLWGLAWDDELAEAERNLAEFEEANALFIGGNGATGVPEGAKQLIIEIRLDEKVGQDLIMTEKLKMANFVYVGPGADGTEIWNADPNDNKARNFCEEHGSDARVVELRAE